MENNNEMHGKRKKREQAPMHVSKYLPCQLQIIGLNGSLGQESGGHH